MRQTVLPEIIEWGRVSGLALTATTKAEIASASFTVLLREEDATDRALILSARLLPGVTSALAVMGCGKGILVHYESHGRTEAAHFVRDSTDPDEPHIVN